MAKGGVLFEVRTQILIIHTNFGPKGLIYSAVQIRALKMEAACFFGTFVPT
jgi:hypothetical protein